MVRPGWSAALLVSLATAATAERAAISFVSPEVECCVTMNTGLHCAVDRDGAGRDGGARVSRPPRPGVPHQLDQGTIQLSQCKPELHELHSLKFSLVDVDY